MSRQSAGNSALRFLASLYFSIPVMLVMAFACAIATIIESRLGTPASWVLVYKAHWFEALFVILALSMLSRMWLSRPWRARHSGSIVLHLSLVVIIIGAGMTRYLAYEGSMSIRENETVSHISSRGDFLMLSADGEQDAAPVLLWRPGPSGIKRKLSVGGRTYKLALTEYYAHVSERLVEGEGDESLLRFAILGDAGMRRQVLSAGESISLDGMELNLALQGVPVGLKGDGPSPRLSLSADESGKIQAISDVALRIVDMGDADDSAAGELKPAGEAFELEMMRIYKHEDFSLVPIEFLAQAAFKVAPVDDPNTPPGARVTVTLDGETVGAVLIRGGAEETLSLGGRELSLSFGPQRIDLPYGLELTEFKMLTYPGSNNPSGYESYLRLHDHERGVHAESVKVFMNHPYSYRGFKHFQSSYHPDQRGTILSVAHDPGKYVTYAGYSLLGLGMLMALFIRTVSAARARREL